MLSTTDLDSAKKLSEREMIEAEGIFGLVQRVQVETAAQYETTAGWLQDLKAKQRELEDNRKEIIKPLNEVKKLVDALFDRPLSKLKAAEQMLKAALIGYQERAAKREQAALEQAVVASNAGDSKTAVALIAQASAQQATASGISTREVYKFEIVDASLLPRDLLIPDEKAIGALVRAKKGQIEIPGVKVVIEKSMTVRAS